MKKVLIIYKYLPQYRVDFFQQLKSKLLEYNVELDLIYGKSNKIDALKKDEAEINWAKLITNINIEINGKALVWQPCIKSLRNKDLIIVLPENKLIINYFLMISRFFSKHKLAFWGHVYSSQKNLNNWRNRLKLLFLNQCDWWFAYTEGSKDFLVAKKYPSKQITIVQNAIDTIDLNNCYKNISDETVQDLKDQLGIHSDKVGIFCGAMYPDKSFDFILEACYIVKKTIPDFHMIFLGSGIEAIKIEGAAKEYNWIHYVGSKFGRDRIAYFKIASIQLMPRLVGLAILDSFAMETPIITTVNPFHGPEIEYLQNGTNGIKTQDNISDYSTAVVEVLMTGSYRELLEGGKISARKYTVENMVENFKNGIIACLNSSNN